MFSRLSCLAIVLLLVVAYFVSPSLPYWTGWENGPVENTQAALLFLGGLFALRYRAQSGAARYQSFWLMVSPIWFVMAMRELSWGAVFMAPLALSPETGPTFSSSQQLGYKFAVAPVVGALALACVWTFVRSQQYLTLRELWKGKAFPLSEIALFALCMVVSAAAEGHMGLTIPFVHEWARQNLEEIVELLAYLSLFAAQWRVRQALLRLPAH